MPKAVDIIIKELGTQSILLWIGLVFIWFLYLYGLPRGRFINGGVVHFKCMFVRKRLNGVFHKFNVIYS